MGVAALIVLAYGVWLGASGRRGWGMTVAIALVFLVCSFVAANSQTY